MSQELLRQMPKIGFLNKMTSERSEGCGVNGGGGGVGSGVQLLEYLPAVRRRRQDLITLRTIIVFTFRYLLNPFKKSGIISLLIICSFFFFTSWLANLNEMSPDRACDALMRSDDNELAHFFYQLSDVQMTSDFFTLLANCTEKMRKNREGELVWSLAGVGSIPLHGYDVTIEPGSAVCGKPSPTMSPQASVLIYVYTTPANVKFRQIIRQTWADRQQPLYSKLFYKPLIIFVMGRPASQTVQEQVFYEAELHGDILQSDFLDTYYNLTLKGMSAIGWAYRNCPLVDYYLKIDDDVFLNTFAFLSYLSNKRRDDRSTSSKHEAPSLFCYVHEHSTVLRWGKYAVSYGEFFDRFYPSFCGGPAYAMNRNALEAIFAKSLAAKFFKLEDVFITGFLAHLANVTQVSISNSYIHGGYRLEKQVIDDEWTTFFFSHMDGLNQGDLNRWKTVWDFLKKRY